MRCLGQCLNLGTISNDEIANIVALHRDAVDTVWQIACNLQKAHVRTEEPSVKQRCAHLIPSSPQAVTDQVARTSSDGLLVGNDGM
jgi:hypothetical protein